MHRSVFAILTLALAVSPAVAQQAQASATFQPALSADDETAVRALVDAFADSWTRHDLKAMHDLDTDDVEWVNVVGHHWRGKETVRKGHMAIHKGMDAHSSLSVEATSLHPIAPDVAVVVATLHFSRKPTDPFYTGNGDTKTRAACTMVKRGGVWKIAQFQNTIVDPKAEQDDLPSFSETGFPPPHKQ